ncbi:MAG: CPBP family intramembrane metalloprotease [Clostridiales bacterium]|nr:CPBP family intramembrane metalloprotease [Clostridiales bacterium]
MQRNSNKNNNFIYGLLGEPTAAKASGLTYSLAAVGSVVLAFFFMMMLAVAGVTVEEGREPDWYLYCSFLMTPLVFGIVAALSMGWTKTSWKTETKRQKCKVRYFFIAIALQVGLLSLSELNTLFLEFLARFGYQDTPIRLPSMDGFGFVGVMLAVALLPAVFEEIIFRGFLLKGMDCFGTVGAVLLCGGLFALYHQNPAQTVYQFCCGAAFALVAIRSGSILPTVVSHFINNALIITLTKLGLETFTKPVFITVLCISVICLVGSLAWLIFFEKRTLDETSKDKKSGRKNLFKFAALGIALCSLTWFGVLLSGI